jgi:hypothetical protein
MGVTEDQPQVPDCYKNPSSTHRLGIPIETLESARKIVRVSYDGVQPTAEELERTENRR